MALTAPAWCQTAAGTGALDQAFYKGLIGNALEAVPMEARARVELQRVNAVVRAPQSPPTGAVRLQASNPLLMIGGLVWGFWAASQIDVPPPPAEATPEPVLVAAAAPAGAPEAAPEAAPANVPRARVIRIWPTQRSSEAPRY
jgi:hypothetical protein